MNPQNRPTQAGPAPAPAVRPPASAPTRPPAAPVQGESDKQYLTAWFLSYFLGVFGVDRFYLGYTGLGIAKLLTFGGCGIWALVDWILIFAGVTKDRQGRPLKDREKHLKLTIIIFLVLFALGAITGAVNGVFISKGVKEGIQSTPTTTTSMDSMAGHTSSKATEVGLNTAARDGKFEFTVTSIECGKTSVGSSQYLTKTPQGQYCLLNVKIKNIGDAPQTFSSTYQSLHNASGQKYSADDTATIYAAPQDNSGTWYSEINPGNSVTGAVVFDLPKDQTPVMAELHDSAFSNGVIVKLQ